MRLSYVLALGALTTTATAVDLQMSDGDVDKVWEKVGTLRTKMNKFLEARKRFDDAGTFDRNSVKSLTADSRGKLMTALDDAADALTTMTTVFENYECLFSPC